MDTSRLIVVGVDGSDDGLRAVRFGAGVAHMSDSELLLVHAVDDAMLAGAWGVVYDPEVLQDAGAAANERAVEVALTEQLSRDMIRTEVVLGSPGGVLSRLSEVADLLVVGRRSVSGFERMFVGSTSVTVVANSQCPVVVISAEAHPGDVGAKGLVGVGLNTNPGNHTILEAGFSNAVSLGCDLEIVHVLQPPHGLFGGKLSPSELDGQLRYIRGGVTAMAEEIAAGFPETSYEIDVLAGSPITELVERSKRYDMLVLGVGGSDIPGFGLGGLLRGLMAHAECPLLVTR